MAVLFFAIFLLLVIFLAGFLLTCKLRKKGPNYDDLAQNEPGDLESEMAAISSPSKYRGLESESDDEETF